MNQPAQQLSRNEGVILLLAGLVLLVVSGIAPKDRATWWMEVAPVLVAAPLLVLTAARFAFTPLVYRLVFLHAGVLILGGHYTYAEVPMGFWFQDLLDLSRNHYDRLGHFMQGLVPALVAREMLLRMTPLQRGPWLFGLVLAVCLAISAFYELIEWWAALLGGEAADAFLGTQGDVWDTQWDMFMALLGAIAGQSFLGTVQDRQMGPGG